MISGKPSPKLQSCTTFCTTKCKAASESSSSSG